MGTVIPENKATFEFEDFVKCVRGSVVRPGAAAQVVGVSTDSRRVQAGNAFVALCGERFDGHDHARSASEAGASVVVVSREVQASAATAVVRVDDTLEALGRLAQAHRRRWGRRSVASGSEGTVVGITGSAGKTTTCRAVAAVLGAPGAGAVHTTAGNLNNAIGIPLVLLGLEEGHGQAVVEIGTNHAGEIAYGARLAEPNVGVLTMIACAHTEGLGSIEAVAEEKGALFAALGPGDVCVANADDPLVLAQAKRSSGARVLTFGTANHADVRVVDAISRGCDGQIIHLEAKRAGQTQRLTASVPLLGAAGLYASAAALAVAWAARGEAVDLSAAAEALSGLRAEAGRLKPRTLGRGALLIDDAYNANPASMRDSIEVAAKIAAELDRRLVLVLGEMRELGAQSESEHRGIGKLVASLRPAQLIAVGGDAREFARACGTDGVASEFTVDAKGAVERLLDVVETQDVILVKGSRGIALERVVAALEVWGAGRSR